MTWAGGTGDSAACASGLFFEETKLPALRSYVALWLVLAAITLTIISVPNLPVAIYEQVWVHLMVGIRRVVVMNVVQVCAGLAMLVANIAFVVLTPGGVAAAVLIYCGVLVLKGPVMVLLA